MKRIRIETKVEHTISIALFETAESLYYYLTEDESQSAGRASLGMAFVEVRPGQTIEVEWSGCEFTSLPVLNKKDVRLDYVKFVKYTIDKNGDPEPATFGEGWTTENFLSFRDLEDDSKRVTRLNSQSECMIDFSTYTFPSENE